MSLDLKLSLILKRIVSDSTGLEQRREENKPEGYNTSQLHQPTYIDRSMRDTQNTVTHLQMYIHKSAQRSRKNKHSFLPVSTQNVCSLDEHWKQTGSI